MELTLVELVCPSRELLVGPPRSDGKLRFVLRDDALARLELCSRVREFGFRGCELRLAVRKGLPELLRLLELGAGLLDGSHVRTGLLLQLLDPRRNVACRP